MKINYGIFASMLFLFIGTDSFSLFTEQNTLNKNVNHVIVIYGSSQCMSCIEIKSELKKWDKAFAFYDIDENEAALMDMLKLLKNHGISTKNLAIPVVRMDDKVYTNADGTEQLILTLKKHLNL